MPRCININAQIYVLRRLHVYILPVCFIIIGFVCIYTLSAVHIRCMHRYSRVCWGRSENTSITTSDVTWTSSFFRFSRHCKMATPLPPHTNYCLTITKRSVFLCLSHSTCTPNDIHMHTLCVDTYALLLQSMLAYASMGVYITCSEHRLWRCIEKERIM